MNAAQTEPKARILVVDDEPLKRITLQIELTEAGYEVHDAADAATARRIFDSVPIDVVVSDVRMPGMDGVELLGHIRRSRPETAVILMTAYGSVETAVRAIKCGAQDYITKPFTTQTLLAKLEQMFAERPPGGAAADESVETFGRLAARGSAMKRLFAQARAIADTERPILLYGERGSGKELLAEAIHRASPRRQGPFERCECAAASPESLEAELCGPNGKLATAVGGTLLVCDVDALPAGLQNALLSAMESSGRTDAEAATPDDAYTVPPTRPAVRIICAARRDLSLLVREGRFREDLYYKLSAIALSIPPLRERPADIPALVRHFMEKHASLAGGKTVAVEPAAMEELTRHSWPGNVRELEHVVERALAFCDGTIRPEHVLPLASGSEQAPDAAIGETGDGTPLGLNATVADIERRMILMALRQCEGNQARAAQRLGIPRTTLRDKMARYSIGCSE